MATNIQWGLLAPEKLSIARRTRPLGLRATIRAFNDLAVPGLGGVWYGKQILLATLGVIVAQKSDPKKMFIQNIEVANAIEALGCYFAFTSNKWTSDDRLLGINTLQGKDDFSFQKVRQKNFYVTQPMRMLTIQALPALGFVEPGSTRFNAFRCSDVGERFVETAMGDYNPYSRTVTEHLIKWVLGGENRIQSSQFQAALSPLIPLSEDAILLLRERLIQGGIETSEDKRRRINALEWVNAVWKSGVESLSWENKPKEISEEHWHDLRTGALFFQVRDAAIDVLDALEVHIGNKKDGTYFSLKENIPESLQPAINHLKKLANNYLDEVCNKSDTNEGAKVFCLACKSKVSSDILRFLVGRDQHVLRLVDNLVKPGSAFDGSLRQYNAENDEDEQIGGIPLPVGISYRMRNLFRLNLDMNGKLGEWLKNHKGGHET